MDTGSKRKKRFLIIGGILLILLSLFLFFFLRKPQGKELVEKAKNLFPFGEPTQVSREQVREQAEGGETVSTEGGEQEPARQMEPRLRQVSDFPTGGELAFVERKREPVVDIIVNAQGEKQEVTHVRPVERHKVRYSDIEAGNIYEAELNPYEIKRKQLAENLIPNVEHAFFSPDREHVALQYWDRSERAVETFLGRVTKKEPIVEPCPFEFKEVELGDQGSHVYDLHVFLNRDPKTRVSLEGVDSPGNEGDVATEKTITAIKNFQAVYGLEPDGKVGGQTKKKMEEICNQQQEREAEERLKEEEYQYEINGTFLPKRIITLAMDPEGKKVFYMTDVQGTAVGSVRNFETGEKQKIFEMPFTEWLSEWNADNTIQITTKPTYFTDGYSYELNATTGDFHKVLKEKGLNVLPSPDGKKFFIHAVEGEGNTSKNAIYHKDSGLRFAIEKFKTFPEKCVWTHDSRYLYCFVPTNLAYDGFYPDRWYQGYELFTDQLWRIDGDTGIEELVSDIPTEYGKELDAIKVTIDDDDSYLYFIDKGSETLWSYRLVGEDA